MFAIANSFPNRTAFGSHSNSLLSQNLLVRRATDLLDETLHCMIASHQFSLEQVCELNKSSLAVAAPHRRSNERGY